MRYLLVWVLLFSQAPKTLGQNNVHQPPLRVGVVGLVHGHVHWILDNTKKSNIEIVGIAEPNRELAERLTRRYGLSMDLVFDSLDEMVKATRPEAVNAFNSTYGHLETVRYCAPQGIHVMVEKPLAVSWAHAREMAALAKKHDIHLLTNYETSWYGSNKKAYELIHGERAIGPMRKIVFHTGHMGPEEIGCSKEFLEWLTDPVLNGGGALTDFGCYGANLSTWLMKGETPESVTCITRQLKPERYPKVDDDATIILKYAQTEVIIQASWNWPHHVKDMEVFGTRGFVKCKNGEAMEVMFDEKEGPRSMTAEPLPTGDNDPFERFRRVVRGSYQLPPYDPSSLENAEVTVQILEAAKLSAQSGQTVFWKDLSPAN